MSDIIGALDPDVIQMVKFFNKNGHLTHMSCQGHNRTNMSMFWIEFYQSVTENDIVSFQRKHLNRLGGFPSNGRFVLRLLANSKNVTHSWQYMAATQEAADADLHNWTLIVINKKRGAKHPDYKTL